MSESDTLLNGYQVDSYHTLNEITASLGLYLRAVTGLSDDVRISEIKVYQEKIKRFWVWKIGPVDANDHIGGNYAAYKFSNKYLPFSKFSKCRFYYFFDAGDVWVDYSSSIDRSNEIRSSSGWPWIVFTNRPIHFYISSTNYKKSSDQTQSFQFNIGTTF